MPPRLVMKKFDMTVIRPMCLVHESDLLELAQIRGYRKQVKNCHYEAQSHLKQYERHFASTGRNESGSSL